MSLKVLYQKVAAFESSLGEEARSLSQCKKGCSRCCYVDLSVFEIEASAMREWFRSQPAVRKEELRKLWNEKRETGACPFLRDDACTVYEARPLICRSQGLPFRFTDAGQSFLDICPLNEDMLVVAGESEIVNLDLLNLILSKLEREYGSERPRVRLHDLLQEFS